jgi:hypothetical protein
MKTGGLDGCGTSKKSPAGAGLNDNAIVGRVRTPSLPICDDSVLGQYLYGLLIKGVSSRTEGCPCSM